MSDVNSHLLSAALRYADMGYPIFPCVSGQKIPLTKQGFKNATTNLEQIEMWWKKNPNANIGIPTAGLLVVDVDGADNAWPEDASRTQDLAHAPMSSTPGGGNHYLFRQPEGKQWKNTAGKLAVKVDTRANGGYIVVPPSVVGGKSYEWVFTLDGGPGELPEPSGWLVEALDGTNNDSTQQNGNANSLPSKTMATSTEPLPGEGNPIPSGQRNDTLARIAGAMRRVGMSLPEILPSLMQVNANRCTPPLTMSEVEKIARSICRYEPDQTAVAVTENHWAQDFDRIVVPDEQVQALPDPGLIPNDLLRIPGFVSEVMDYCLETAPYPNPIMAFCGALSLQAFLAGRKVRDSGDNRSNFYILGLAHSAAGKDWPRKINTCIAHEIGLSDSLGDRFASGEGIQDALFINPCMLFQTDEIDGMLQSINKARDARYESILSTLMTMYSSSNSVFPRRRKAGQESPGVIDQPCLNIFGTAIPNHYYESLSERMLTSGFFARMIILESDKRGKGQEAKVLDIPQRIISVAKWWAEYLPGKGNLQTWHPLPPVVEHTDEAKQVLIDTREEADREYAKAEERRDPVGTTVWGRVSEQTHKLALLYATSCNHETPKIDLAAATWACEFILHQTRRMLYMAQNYVSNSPFHADCLKLMQKLREAPEGELPHSVLLKRMKTDARSFLEVISTLVQRGDIEIITVPRAGTARKSYRLYGVNGGVKLGVKGET